MKPNVANAQTLLDTFCGTKVPRRSTANLQKKFSKSCQIMMVKFFRIFLPLLEARIFFWCFARLQSKGKISAGLVPIVDWQLAFRSVSLSNLYAQKYLHECMPLVKSSSIDRFPCLKMQLRS